MKAGAEYIRQLEAYVAYLEAQAAKLSRNTFNEKNQ